MDIERTREIIYYPLKQQRLPKYVKRTFSKFALSNFDLLYPFKMFDYRNYVNHLLDIVHENYSLNSENDDNMHINAVRLDASIYNKYYMNICTY